MRKLFLLPFTFALSSFYGQVWFDFGLNSSMGSGFYTGKTFYNDSRFNLVPKLNNAFGLKIGVNPAEKHSAVIELGYANRAYAIDQAFVPGKNENTVFTQQLNFSGFQGALLYRNTNEGTFVEIGPMFSMIQNQSLSDQASSSYTNQSILASRILRGVFGLGGYILGSERVTLVGGIRVLYDFSDLRSKEPVGEAFPFQNYNENALHQPLKAIDIQINLELNISLGFLARASCGKRKVIFEW
jgi:hypothetical protein